MLISNSTVQEVRTLLADLEILVDRTQLPVGEAFDRPLANIEPRQEVTTDEAERSQKP